MSSIKRLWAVVSIIAILRPSLINSLPQDSLWSYYNRDHDNVAPVANANLLNGKDGKYGDTSSTPQDTGSDTILASNTGRLVSNKDGFPIFVNTEHSAANCQRKTDLESGALSGRAVPEECDATDGNGASPTTEAERDFVDCPEPWIWHLCGWGPASSFGRVDILDWPIHRTWVNNVWRTCQNSALYFEYGFLNPYFFCSRGRDRMRGYKIQGLLCVL